MREEASAAAARGRGTAGLRGVCGVGARGGDGAAAGEDAAFACGRGGLDDGCGLGVGFEERHIIGWLDVGWVVVGLVELCALLFMEAEACVALWRAATTSFQWMSSFFKLKSLWSCGAL